MAPMLSSFNGITGPFCETIPGRGFNAIPAPFAAMFAGQDVTVPVPQTGRRTTDDGRRTTDDGRWMMNSGGDGEWGWDGSMVKQD